MEFTNVGKTAAKLRKSPIFVGGIIAVVGYVLFRKIILGNSTIGSTTPPIGGGNGIDTQTLKESIDAAISDYDTSLESRLLQFDSNVQDALGISTGNLESEIGSITDSINQQVEQSKIDANNELQNIRNDLTQLEQSAPTVNIQPVGQPITTIAAAKNAWNIAHAAGNTAGELAAHAAADKIRGYRTNSSGTTRVSQPRTTRVSQPINSIAAAKTAWNLAHARGDTAGELAAHAAADRIRGYRTNSSGRR